MLGETHEYEVLGVSLEDAVHMHEVRVIQLRQNVQFARQKLPDDVLRRICGIDDLASQDAISIRLILSLIFGQIYL